MTTKDKRKKFINEFSTNYSELFVSVFLLKYNQQFKQKDIIEDIEDCIKLSNKKIIQGFADGIKYDVKEEEN